MTVLIHAPAKAAAIQNFMSKIIAPPGPALRPRVGHLHPDLTPVTENFQE